MGSQALVTRGALSTRRVAPAAAPTRTSKRVRGEEPGPELDPEPGPDDHTDSQK